MQAARRSVPPDVVADMKRKQATKTVKSLKARGANDSARAAEKKEREVLSSDPPHLNSASIGHIRIALYFMLLSR